MELVKREMDRNSTKRYSKDTIEDDRCYCGTCDNEDDETCQRVNRKVKFIWMVVNLIEF